jgi:hypothetical protein
MRTSIGAVDLHGKVANVDLDLFVEGGEAIGVDILHPG